jgi:hypothetical protein
VRLWLNDQLIIDRLVDQPPTEAMSVPVQLQAGQTYSIRMDYYENAGGAVARLSWSSARQPKSVINGRRLTRLPDQFAAAELMTGNSPSVAGNNVGATAETGEPIHFNGGKSVWLKWVAPNSGEVTISTSGSDFDTTLAAYTGISVNALTVAQVNDDFQGASSQLKFNVTGGTLYHIAVDGFGGATGNINLTLNLTRPVVQVFADAGNAAERPLGAGRFLFEINPMQAQPYTVDFTLSGVAVPGVDYTTTPPLASSSSSITFAPGTRQQLLTITPLADNNPVEGRESVVLTLNAAAPYTVGTSGAAQLHITDDSPYSTAWMSRFSGLSALNGGPTLDPDVDGDSNLLEFSFDMNPFGADDPSLSPTTALQEFVDAADGATKFFQTISFIKRTDAPALTYIPESTDDLGGGLWSNDLVLVSTEPGPTAVTQRVTYRSRVPATRDTAVKAGFMRVRVVAP